MREVSYETYIEQIKLTLNALADAKVIAILKAMPYGNKARLITDALRRCYTVNKKGELVVVVTEQPIVLPPVSADAPTPSAAPNTAKQGGKPITIDVETF